MFAKKYQKKIDKLFEKDIAIFEFFKELYFLIESGSTKNERRQILNYVIIQKRRIFQDFFEPCRKCNNGGDKCGVCRACHMIATKNVALWINFPERMEIDIFYCVNISFGVNLVPLEDRVVIFAILIVTAWHLEDACRIFSGRLV